MKNELVCFRGSIVKMKQHTYIFLTCNTNTNTNLQDINKIKKWKYLHHTFFTKTKIIKLPCNLFVYFLSAAKNLHLNDCFFCRSQIYMICRLLFYGGEALFR